MDVLVGVLIFVGVFVAGPYLAVVGLRRSARAAATATWTRRSSPGPRAREWPLACRLRLYHRWRTHRTPDGVRYQRCLGCGATRDVPGVGLPI